ncbi:hypothetical protein HWV62_2770 [Athelia sp. TMB]|nr:hypothetical protein HWV62_2770 [Athelia sp. TMB]
MDLDSESILKCHCGKAFRQDNAYSTHRKVCPQAKKRTRDIVAQKLLLLSRKKQRRDETQDRGSASLQPKPAEAAVSTPTPPIREPPEPIHVQDGNSGIQGCPSRLGRLLPKHFRDQLPAPAPSLPPVLPHEPPDLSATNPSTPLLPKARVISTPRNIFGVICKYFTDRLPTRDPEENMTLAELAQSSVAEDSPAILLTPRTSFHPYPNKSSFLLGDWFWNGLQKSKKSFAGLIKILTHPDFNLDDIQDTKWSSIDANLATTEMPDGPGEDWVDVDDAGWKKSKIAISVPFHKRQEVPGPCDYKPEVDFHHRSLVDVIKERISDPETGNNFHLEPYELLWKPNDNVSEERLHGEIYTSPEFHEAHRLLQESPREPGCDLQRVIAALMFCHIAYFQNLPPDFKAFLNERVGGKGAKPALQAHCRREFFHEQWRILLDDDFVDAYKHGIVIKCFDGIHRRFYPRILTYSADYPEK